MPQLNIQRPSDGIWAPVQHLSANDNGTWRTAKKLYVMQVDDITNPSNPTYTWRLVHDWSPPTQLVPNVVINATSDGTGPFAQVTWTEAAAGSTEDASNVTVDFYKNNVYWMSVSATEDSHSANSDYGTSGDDIYAIVYYSNNNGTGPSTTTSHVTLGGV